jgi:Zn-dependent oligopeptidase
MGAIAPGVRDEARYDYAAMTPATVTDATEAALAEAERLIAAVVSATGPRTYDTTIRPLGDAAAVVAAADGVGSSIGYVHPDAAVRDAANAAEERLQKWRSGLARRDDLAAAILAYADTDDAAAIDGSRRQSLDLWLRDIRRAGHGLAPDERAEFADLRDRLADLSVAFGRNLGDWRDDMVLAAADLEGLPQSFVDRLPAGPEPGSRLLAAGYATTFAFIEQSPRRDLREIAIAKYYSRAAPLNAPILAKIVAGRRRAAAIVGADSWSQFANEARMSGGRAEVMAFLEGLIGPLQSLAGVEQAAMLEQLRAAGVDDVLRLSDWTYLHERQRESVGVDFERLAEYFPVDGVLERMIDLLGEVFGVAIVPVPGASVWHPDVRVYRIDDATTGEHLADVYLDLFGREGKRPGGWMQTLRMPDNTPGRPRRPAVIQLVLNFAAPTGTGPTLLRHDDVVGLIHEFGHVLEFGLARNDGAMISESWIELDFVEAPSQIMEHWAWSPVVIQRLGRHHQTGAPPPDDLVAGLREARQLNIGTHTLFFFIFRALLDQYLHGPEPVDAMDAYRRAFAVTGFPFMEGTFQPASFDHITGNYDAGFYSYIWAQVFGDDMFSAFRDGGLLSAKVGARYRREVLEPSWGVPGRQRVENFLGRPPSDRAFLERLGIADA